MNRQTNDLSSDFDLHELIEQLARGNCILFVGAGVAPSGEGAFEEQLMAELLSEMSGVEIERKFPLVAKRYEQKMGTHRLIERVCSWTEAQSKVPNPLDLIIPRLPFPVIITTRIDMRLKEAYDRAQKPLIYVVRDDMVTFVDSQRTTLIQAYGSTDQRDSLVLTENDCLDFPQKRSYLCEWIRYLCATRTLLFCGYDLNDVYWKFLYRQIGSGTTRFPRRVYAVQPHARPEDKDDWKLENIKIHSEDPFRFFQILEQQLARYEATTPKISTNRIANRPHSPYRFLDYFETNQSDQFFGRQQEISVLSKVILTRRLQILVGSSGVGKTSCIKAGLIPALTKLNCFPIYSRCLDAPLNAIEKDIADAVEAEYSGALDVEERGDERLLKLLLRVQQRTGKTVILFIDQFEEVFRLEENLQQELTRALVQCLQSQRIDLHLVLSLRDDFLVELEGMKKHFRQPYFYVERLNNLSKEGAREAITRPLEPFGIQYQEGLVDQILEELRYAGSIAPAQLQIVCYRLYQEHAKDTIITIDHYRAMGGAREILGNYLMQVLEKFSHTRRATAKRILQSLVTIRQTKNLLSKVEIATALRQGLPYIENILTELIDHHLLRRIETEAGYRYEVVHEYIVTEIWKWLSEREIKIKEAQDLLDMEVQYWPRYQQLITKEKLKDICSYWRDLTISNSARKLLFRSLVFVDFLSEWEAIASSLGDQLIPSYADYVADDRTKISRYAAIALHKLGAIAELDRALKRLPAYHQQIIRKMLSQKEEGRPDQDIVEQITDPDWEERSLWNTSSAVGIDFGTTSSLIAVVRNGKPIIIPNREGIKLTPSVVAFTRDGEVTVGASALLQAQINAEGTVFAIKRLLGSSDKIKIYDRLYTPEEIAAHIFAFLKQDAESYLERPISEAVVTVPAYFNRVQSATTKRAAEQAGWKVLRIIAEPTAASFAYSAGYMYDRTVAVYDLGGGTFDISLLDTGNTEDGGFVGEILSVNGDTRLGGMDFDTRIMHHIIEIFKRQNGIDLSQDKEARVRLMEAAERAKIALSGQEIVTISVPYITADAEGAKHLNVDLSRATFEQLTADLVERTMECCQRAIEDAKIKIQNIDELVLVGLSTKIPLVREAAGRFFGKEPKRGIDPDEAVALGAALEAGILTGTGSGEFKNLLLDATSLSLGIETQGGVFTRLIERNTSIPTRKSDVFSTAEDNQISVTVNIYEGEREIAIANKFLGEVYLEGIPPAPRGIPQLEVIFDIDANNLLMVSIRDKATGRDAKKIFRFDSDSEESASPNVAAYQPLAIVEIQPTEDLNEI
ncbi:MAG TPA: Hsp70 family protein [Chthonomonadaceae bacterium]|nr:Hsp70 family protein [Chthonomonadaceae bacterium]